MDVSKIRDPRVHFRNSRAKGLNRNGDLDIEVPKSRPIWHRFRRLTLQGEAHLMLKYNKNVTNLLSLQTITDTCVNSVDPDETAHHEPSHQELHCLPCSYYFVTLCNYGRVQILNGNPISRLIVMMVICEFRLTHHKCHPAVENSSYKQIY